MQEQDFHVALAVVVLMRCKAQPSPAILWSQDGIKAKLESVSLDKYYQTWVFRSFLKLLKPKVRKIQTTTVKLLTFCDKNL